MASWLDKYMTPTPARQTPPAPEFVTLATPGDPHAERYALGALRRAADNIATTPEGTRNDTLNAESWSIGQLVKDGHLDYQTAVDTLNAAAIECGLDQTEIDRTVPRAIQQAEKRNLRLDPTYGVEDSQIGFTPTTETPNTNNNNETDKEAEEGEDGSDSATTPSREEQARQAAKLRWEQEVQHETRRLAITEEAKRAWQRHKANELLGTITPPIPLDDFLAVKHPPTKWIIEGLQPVGTRALLAAQAKSGKTTMVANLIKALADEQPFLGKYINRFTGTITLIDDELDERMLQDWLANIGITNTSRVRIKTLRGKLSQFNIVDDETRRLWAEQLTGTDYLILDCLRPVLDANGLDENHEAGIFLNAFDALLAEAHIDSGLIVHHMGHGAQRSRGDSRIMDWPDALWKLTKTDPDDMASPRQFEAFGREVNIEKHELDYRGGKLTLAGARPKNHADPYMWTIQTIAWTFGNNPTPKSKLETQAHTEKDYNAPSQAWVREAVNFLTTEGAIEKKGRGYIINATNPLVQKAIAWSP